MSDDRSGFEDLFRKFAEEVQRGIERASGDLEGLARMNGVDPDEAKRWIDGAGQWLRDQVDSAGPFGPTAPQPEAGADAPPERPGGPLRADDPLQGATPHPLDLPTADQGVAL